MLAALAATVAAAAFVQGSAGVGFALIVAPASALLCPQLLPSGLLVLMLPLNAYVAWRERASVDRPGTAWITAGRLVGTAGGLWLLAVVSPGRVSSVVAVATLLAVAATALAPSFDAGPKAFLSAGAVTGDHRDGDRDRRPPLALVYQHRPGPVLRSTIAVCFLAGEVVSLGALGAAGRVGAGQLWIAALLPPPLALGTALSRHVHRRLDGPPVRALVLAFAAASAVAVLARG